MKQHFGRLGAVVLLLIALSACGGTPLPTTNYGSHRGLSFLTLQEQPTSVTIGGPIENFAEKDELYAALTSHYIDPITGKIVTVESVEYKISVDSGGRFSYRFEVNPDLILVGYDLAIRVVRDEKTVMQARQPTVIISQ